MGIQKPDLNSKTDSWFPEVSKNERLQSLTALVVGAVMVIFAAILASGVFGAGNMYFVAAGLVIGGMLSIGLGVYTLDKESVEELNQS